MGRHAELRRSRALSRSRLETLLAEAREWIDLSLERVLGEDGPAA